MSYIIQNIDSKTRGALSMVSSIGRAYVGLVEVDEKDNMVFLYANMVGLYNPLLYMEMLEQGSTHGSINLKIDMRPIYLSLGFMDNIVISFDTIYALKEDSSQDNNILSAYKDTLSQLLAKNSGIIAPTPNDMRMVTLGNQPKSG